MAKTLKNKKNKSLKKGGDESLVRNINPVGIVKLPKLTAKYGGQTFRPAPASRVAPRPAPAPRVAGRPAPAPRAAVIPQRINIITNPLFPSATIIDTIPAGSVLPVRFWLTNITCMYSNVYNVLINSINSISRNRDIRLKLFNDNFKKIDLPSSPQVDVYPSFCKMKTYTFDPSIFKLSPLNYDNFNNEDRTTYNSLNKIPVYFDFYIYYKLKRPANRTSQITSDDDSPNNNPRYPIVNRNFINSLFVLDINNIPHYLSPGFLETTPTTIRNVDMLCLYKKKNGYMDSYNSQLLHNNSDDSARFLYLDFFLNNIQSNNIDLTRLILTPISNNLEVPNKDYAKTFDSLQNMVDVPGPVVPTRLGPNPAPILAPNPADLSAVALSEFDENDLQSV
jgi:hypothetical protein